MLLLHLVLLPTHFGSDTLGDYVIINYLPLTYILLRIQTSYRSCDCISIPSP